MAVSPTLTAAELLALVPQQRPFRFVDEIHEVDELHIVGSYTFRHDETFYAGHFPGNAITPGVILLEAMAQVGVVALGIYLKSLEVPRDELVRWRSMATDTTVEFCDIVLPGERVVSHATKIFWRRNKIRSKVEMLRDGHLVARCEVAGMGVRSD